MFLLADCVRFSNPRHEFVIKIRNILHAKGVQMISRRESLDARKTGMLNAAAENEVTNEVFTAHLHRDERHAHLKSNAGFFRQNFHRPAFFNHRRERIEQFANVITLSCEV
jgi:hypothetical protein